MYTLTHMAKNIYDIHLMLVFPWLRWFGQVLYVCRGWVKKWNIYHLSCFSWSIFIISKICKWNITRLWHVTSKSFWMWCYANIRLVEVLMWPFWPSSQQVPLVKLFPSNWCVYLSLLNGYSLKEGDKHAMNYARIAFCTKTSTNWCLHC